MWRVLGLLVVAAAELGAQTLPLPAPPAEPAPESPRARRWEYAFGVGAGWDSNIDFRDPEGAAGLATVLHGGLARVFTAPHSQLRATAGGRWTGYPDQAQARRYNADLGLDGSYQPSANVDWRGSLSYDAGYSDSSPVLLEQGVLLPVVRTRTLSASLGLSNRLSSGTTLRVDGRFYHTSFDSPGLIDGTSTRASVGLERQLSERSTGAAFYALELVASGPSYLTHFGSLQWTRRLSLRSSLLLEAGASYTPDSARAALEHAQGFFGGASFTRTLRRSSLALFVRREVTPAFGSGVSRPALRLGARAAFPIARDWQLRLTGSHVEPMDQQLASSVDFASDDASVTLARRLARHVDVSADVRYRRRAATAAAVGLESFQAWLFVSLSP